MNTIHTKYNNFKIFLIFFILLNSSALLACQDCFNASYINNKPVISSLDQHACCKKNPASHDNKTKKSCKCQISIYISEHTIPGLNPSRFFKVSIKSDIKISNAILLAKCVLPLYIKNCSLII
ncbi:hypothetical protein HY745_05245 [Candidatus Desantisbacteria bacterium]|nr:hypothetical protein [Candidatus Desantisbacteria bacterium]